MLRLEGLRKSFGGQHVVRDCSLEVRPGEIVGLIGPNGAGKTTVFNLVTSVIRADGGAVWFKDRDITTLATEEIASYGLVRTFQIPALFEDLSVIENLLVAAPNQGGEHFWNVWFRPGLIRREESMVEDEAWKTLDLLNLTRVANRLAAHLSGGQKKLVELGRVLMARPSLVLLDEPVAGVTPALIDEISARIRQLRKDGLTLLLVEHKMDFVMSLCDRLYVMAAGSVLAEGRPEEIRANREVLDAYLGVA
jgi:ABC-type branched-subunit amino acid transport system ATPase component